MGRGGSCATDGDGVGLHLIPQCATNNIPRCRTNVTPQSGSHGGQIDVSDHSDRIPTNKLHP